MGMILGIVGFFKGIPRWVYAAIFAAAAVLFLIHAHGNKVRDAYNDAYNAGWSKEHAGHLITLRSLGDALAIIAAKNKESDARAKAFNDAKDADARTIADLDKRYSSTASRVAALTAISRVGGGDGPCKVPTAVAAALEGL